MLNETILNVSNPQMDNLLAGAKSTSITFVSYFRTGMLYLSTWLAKVIPFEADKINLGLFIVISLFISYQVTKNFNSKSKWAWTLGIGGAIMYILYFW